MDERFPKWLRVVVGKLDFMGLPNLGMFVAALAVLGFIGSNFLGASFDRFVFDPQLVLQGEWWRLFAFPVTQSSPIWVIFYVWYVYYVLTALEGSWGEGPVTVFVLFSYLCALGASFIAQRPLNIWFHVIENVSLAFGTLFPDIEFLIFFILPVKAKWLAMLAGGLLLFQFIAGDVTTKIFLFVVMFPYLLFFSPMLYQHWQVRRKVAANRKRFKDDMWR